MFHNGISTELLKRASNCENMEERGNKMSGNTQAAKPLFIVRSVEILSASQVGVNCGALLQLRDSFWLTFGYVSIRETNDAVTMILTNLTTANTNSSSGLIDGVITAPIIVIMIAKNHREFRIDEIVIGKKRNTRGIVCTTVRNKLASCNYLEASLYF